MSDNDRGFFGLGGLGVNWIFWIVIIIIVIIIIFPNIFGSGSFGSNNCKREDGYYKE